MFIIPEEVLITLICSACGKYLSVQPIKVYPTRTIKCGRCNEDGDDGVISLYNNIVANGLFPCINRYEGCNRLMNYSEVAAHEKECVAGTYKCPICPSGNEHTSYELLQHYKSIHTKEILEKPVIISNGKIEFENYYLYKENNFIFIIYLWCNLSENCFFLNVTGLGPKERVQRILQYVKCYLNDDKGTEILFFQTEKRPCEIFENNAHSFKIIFPKKCNLVILNICLDKSDIDNFNYFIIDNKSIIETNSITTQNKNIGVCKPHPEIYLSAEYKKKYPDHYLSPCKTKVFDHHRELFPRLCDFCENIFQYSKVSRMFKCRCNHFYCSTCYDISPSCRKECKLEPVENYELLNFYCRWDCGTLCSSDLSHHEDNCPKNSDAGYTLTDLVHRQFSSYLGTDQNYLVSRSNVFSFKNYNFDRNQQVFVITRDNFKFLLQSSFSNGINHFYVYHNYPTDKYYILFKVMSLKEEFYQINKLTILNYSSNIMPPTSCVIRKAFGFTVLLKKK